MEYSVLDISGDPACTALGSLVDTCSTGGFGRIFHIFVAVMSNPEAFCLHSRRMEKRAQSMLLVVVALSAVRTLTLDLISRALYMAVWHFSLRRPAFSGPSMMKNSSSSRAHAN